jgi:hypothetical protein
LRAGFTPTPTENSNYKHIFNKLTIMAKSEKKRKKIFGFHTPFNKPTKLQVAQKEAMEKYLAKKA